MGVHSKLRGHKIVCIDDVFFYADTMEPTVGNRRKCGYCGEENTPEGHDACIGTIAGAMNACCGHGVDTDAYVQLLDGSVLSGKEAKLQ